MKPNDAVVGSSASNRAAVAMTGLLVGVVATLPHLVGPRLDTASGVEVVDHVVPGVIVLATSAAVVAAGRFVRISGTAILGAGLTVVLAGLWMTATHVPLVAQAARHEAPWGATAYHCATAAAVLAVGLVWVRHSWDEA